MEDGFRHNLWHIHEPYYAARRLQCSCYIPMANDRYHPRVIRRFVHVYLDEIFVFSNSIKEHERYLGLVFDKLGKAQLFLEESKLNLYSKKMDCLGHVIDD